MSSLMKRLLLPAFAIMLILSACSINHLPQGLSTSVVENLPSSAAADGGSDQSSPVSPVDKAIPTSEILYQSSNGISSGLHATDPTSFVLASGKIQLVEFFAFWCSDCKSMAPILHSMESKYSSQIHFVYLNVDDPQNSQVLKELNASFYVPEFRILDPLGKTLWTQIGPISQAELEAVILKNLSH